MSAIQVKNSVVYDAIQATDPLAEAIVVAWLQALHPEEDSLVVDLSEPREYGFWFVRHPDGAVMLISPRDFETGFHEVDAVAEFAAQLEQTPTALVADDVAERRQAREQIDAYLAERVGMMLTEFEDLRGMAQDEEDSSAEDGVQWAYERFKAVFGVKEES